ncbi:MAG: hypothetical protein U9N35_03425 [Euryarchaeota archaeon]|nr:hypothetical protein [Euryarchaeota archaeon]
MNNKGGMKLTALLIVITLLATIIPAHSFDRPEEYITEDGGECIGTETFTIDAADTEYAVLEVMGEGVVKQEDKIIKQESIESFKWGTHTQTFRCNGEVTKIDVSVALPKTGPYTGNSPETSSNESPVRSSGMQLSGNDRPRPTFTIAPPPEPIYTKVTLRVLDPNNNVMYRASLKASSNGQSWLSFSVPNLNLNGTYKLEISGAPWHYGSGYANGRADFNANKDFSFRVHYKKKTTVYPELVQYKTDLMGGWETVATNLQSGTATVQIPKENISGATELSLNSMNNSQTGPILALTKTSWQLTTYYTVPETPARLSLPITRVEGESTTFQIRYTDFNNDAPTSAKLYLNNVPHDLASEDDDEYQWNGALYTATLPYEECEYYFVFENGKETIRMPEEGSLTLGALEKTMSEWKTNMTEESQLVDEELEKIDLYYIQDKKDPQILRDMLDVKIDLVKNSAWNHRYMDEIHGLASQREAVQQFENLSDAEIEEAFAEIQAGFPEEVKQIFRDYGLSDSDIEELRTDVLNNKATIKEKRILSNFVDLKNVYRDMGLLHIDSASFTFDVYTREGKFGRTTGPEITTAQDTLKSSWQSIVLQHPNRAEVENVLSNAKYLVEHGYIEYIDDFSAALVYLYLSIAGDDAFTQELYSNSSQYIASQTTEEDSTWQDTFNYAWTVRYQTINDIQPEIVEDSKDGPIVHDLPYLPQKGERLRYIPTPYCPNGTCEPGKGETCHNCAPDCWPCTECGDGLCNGNEDCDSCPGDCDCDDPTPTPSPTPDPSPTPPPTEPPEQDSDGDGVPDNRDNCPNNVNPNQWDKDNDGFGNACDTCIHLNGSTGEIGNGCPCDHKKAAEFREEAEEKRKEAVDLKDLANKYAKGQTATTLTSLGWGVLGVISAFVPEPSISKAFSVYCFDAAAGCAAAGFLADAAEDKLNEDAHCIELDAGDLEDKAEVWERGCRND